MNKKFCELYERLLENITKYDINILEGGFSSIKKFNNSNLLDEIIKFLQNSGIILGSLSLIIGGIIQIHYLLNFDALNLFSYSQLFSDSLILFVLTFIILLFGSLIYLIVFKNGDKKNLKIIGYVSLSVFFMIIFHSYTINYIFERNLLDNIFDSILLFSPLLLCLLFIIGKRKNFYNTYWFVYIYTLILSFGFGLSRNFFDSPGKIIFSIFFVFIFVSIFLFKSLSIKHYIGCVLEFIILITFTIYLGGKLNDIVSNWYGNNYQRNFSYSGVNYKTYYFNDKWVLFRDVDDQLNLTGNKYILPMDDIGIIKIK